MPIAQLLAAFVVATAAAPAAVAPPADLAATLGPIAARAGGKVGIAVIHVESGRSTLIHADTPLRVHSVMKLPVAVALMAEAEAKRIDLGEKLRIERADVRGGTTGNTNRWADVPKELTIGELLDLSLLYSDNTSSDKLVARLGGVTPTSRKLAALKMEGFDLRGTYTTDDPKKANLGSAEACARLLVRLWKGDLLAASSRDRLVDLLTRSPNGARRLRGQLPPGTVAADKTGTGGDGKATNDIGVITLPGQAGHLAMAVLINGSTLPLPQQEDVIAALGRAAYDAFVTPVAATSAK